MTKKAKQTKLDHNHQCFWRDAAIKLAQCVDLTLRSKGRIGVGSGMMMTRVKGKTVIERWDKPFIEALEFIGFKRPEDPLPAKAAAKKVPKHAPRRADKRVA